MMPRHASANSPAWAARSHAPRAQRWRSPSRKPTGRRGRPGHAAGLRDRPRELQGLVRQAWFRQPMPATPEVVGAYLAAAGEGYAMPTLRRRVAAIARACGVAGQPLDTKHPAIRETLRGIGRKHGSTSPASSRTDDGGGQAAVPGMRGDLAGVRDRALFLLGFAGAMRRSELVGLDVEHVTWTADGLKLLIERSKTDARG